MPLKKGSVQRAIDEEVYGQRVFNPNQRSKLDPSDKYYELTQKPKTFNIPKEVSELEKVKTALKDLNRIKLTEELTLKLYPTKLEYKKKW